MEKILVLSEQEYAPAMEAIKKADLISIDTETAEFTEEKTSPIQLDLDGVGFYCEHGAFYIPKRFMNWADVQEIFDTKELIFHNAKFDLTIIEKEGVNVEGARFHDTQLMSYLLNENRPKHGLKYLAETILKVPANQIISFQDTKARPTLDNLGLFRDMYDEEFAEWEKDLGLYCLDDCRYTYELYKIFRPKLEEQGLMDVYNKVEIPMVNVLKNMENRGIKIDMEYLKKMGSDMEIKLIQLKVDIWKLAGKEFDINSPKQLSQVLFKDKGYTASDEFRTKTGALSTGVQALDYLGVAYPEDPFVGKILEYRELFKLHSSFVISLLKKQRLEIIHPSFQQFHTVTGRLSCREPNLQQLPRRDDEFNIRKAFIPREGYVFVISDLSQIELRIAAFFSKDPLLVNAFKEGKDVHQETAEALGISRVLAKTVNFGILFGRTAYGMHKGLGMSPDEAEEFIQKYFAKFKKLATFIQQATNTLKKHYAVQTLFRRKRRFPKYAQAVKARDRKDMGRMERQATNSIIQGTAADLMKIYMHKVAKAVRGFDAHILVAIHDEMIVEVPKDKAEEVMAIVKYQMENSVKLGDVPVITEPAIYDCWQK